MHWTMWHIYGPGFDVADAEPDRIRNFLREHEPALAKEAEKIEDEEGRTLHELLHDAAISDSEFVDTLIDLEYKCGNVAPYIGCVMSEETGIRFDTPGTTEDGEDCVMFCPAMPWEYNEKEKPLTQDELFGLIQKYADELGVKFNPDLDLVYDG